MSLWLRNYGITESLDVFSYYPLAFIAQQPKAAEEFLIIARDKSYKSVKLR